MKKTLFLIILLTGCALFQVTPSTDDPLLHFYSSPPAPHTRASLRVTERAREDIHSGNLDLGIHQLNKALTIDPDNPFAYFFLALAYHEKREFKKSNGFLDKAKRLFSPFPFWRSQSYELSASNWTELGDSKKAEENLKYAHTIENHP